MNNWFKEVLGGLFGAAKQSQAAEDELLSAENLFDFEESLIRADCGLAFSEQLIAQIKQSNVKTKSQASALLTAKLKEALEKLETPTIPLKPIILVAGVNGAGKTTSIGKLAYKLKQEGKKVLLAPGDTFRAAAEEQLALWAERAGVECLAADGKKKADAVLHDALALFRAGGFDHLIFDTAGRLQNKRNLMDELSALQRVIAKSGLAHEFLLVLDASTGQNGLQQAKLFAEALGSLSGLILTKLDGSAKGGVLCSIALELAVPVKFVGVGEKMGDLRVYSAGFMTDLLQG